MGRELVADPSGRQSRCREDSGGDQAGSGQGTGGGAHGVSPSGSRRCCGCSCWRDPQWSCCLGEGCGRPSPSFWVCCASPVHAAAPSPRPPVPTPARSRGACYAGLFSTRAPCHRGRGGSACDTAGRAGHRATPGAGRVMVRAQEPPDPACAPPLAGATGATGAKVSVVVCVGVASTVGVASAVGVVLADVLALGLAVAVGVLEG